MKKDVSNNPPRRIPALEMGVVQHREGVPRCDVCGGEVIVGRTVDGMLVALTVVLGERHVCREQGGDHERTHP